MKNYITFLILAAGLLMTGIKSSGQGNGSDGPFTVSSGTTIINDIASAVSGSYSTGATTINVASSSGFNVGDMAFIVQMFGTNAGLYNELPVASMTGTSLTFSSPITLAFSGASTNRAQIIRIPQYSDFTIAPGATLTAPAWNGATGGVLVYYANGTVSINGTITMTGKGFTGGNGGTGNAAGTGGTVAGLRGAASGDNGTAASPSGGGAGGSSFGGTGGAGGQGNTAASANLGTAGNGIGGGAPGVAGANMSTGIGTLVMGGGGGGGQGGSGGQYGGSGGGGGAASIVLLGSGRGQDGTNGTGGTASTSTGGTGGTGGGVILMRVVSLSGNGTIVSNGSNGTNGTGSGGNGGNGGNGGDGGQFLSGIILSNGGGGGGGGRGGQGGRGPGGGGAGGAGVIAITTYTGTPGWTGTMSNAEGLGGTGGTGGTSGTSGTGGVGGLAWLLGSNGVAGLTGGTVPAGPAGPNGALNPYTNPPVFLPVNLISFSGKVSGTSIVLQWSTTSEETNTYFIIEKSSDGKTFSALGKVNSRGSLGINNYTLTDADPLIGHNYYRLSEVNATGVAKALKVIDITYPSVSGSLVATIYPNPVGGDKTIHFELAEAAASSTKIRLYNMLGEVVFTHETDNASNRTSVVLPGSLVSGIYTVEIASVSEVLSTEKIIIE